MIEVTSEGWLQDLMTKPLRIFPPSDKFQPVFLLQSSHSFPLVFEVTNILNIQTFKEL